MAEICLTLKRRQEMQIMYRNQPAPMFQGSVGCRAQRLLSDCMADIEASKMIVSTAALGEVGREVRKHFQTSSPVHAAPFGRNMLA